jgi:hypothetical protein
MFIEEKLDRIIALLEGLTVGQQVIDAQIGTPKKGRGKANEVKEPSPAQPEQQPAAAAPSAPAISKDQLNKAVLKVAAKSRDAAEAILAKFGAKNTVTLPPEQWQAVYDAFEEEIARMDAAAVQVAQASLV